VIVYCTRAVNWTEPALLRPVASMRILSRSPSTARSARPHRHLFQLISVPRLFSNGISQSRSCPSMLKLIEILCHFLSTLPTVSYLYGRDAEDTSTKISCCPVSLCPAAIISAVRSSYRKQSNIVYSALQWQTPKPGEHFLCCHRIDDWEQLFI